MLSRARRGFAVELDFHSQTIATIRQMPKTSGQIEFVEWGSGPSVLFVPGSFGTGATWKLVIKQLGENYRFITTSLLGYGATEERRSVGNGTMEHQIGVLDEILDRIDAPTHIVAHSFGGLSAIAHALRGHRAAESLTLVEANPLGILRTAGDDFHYGMFLTMTRNYFADYEQGKQDAARHVIDFYGGPGTFDAFPQRVRDYVMATTPSNILDWSSGTPFEPALTEYAQMAVPTLILCGEDGHPAMKRIASLLHDNLRNARIETIAGGSHFLPATHPSELARLIELHLDTYLASK